MAIDGLTSLCDGYEHEPYKLQSGLFRVAKKLKEVAVTLKLAVRRGTVLLVGAAHPDRDPPPAARAMYCCCLDPA